MAKFYPVRYYDKEYPSDIIPKIQEIPANFFRQTLDETELQYLSLHTDPGHRWLKDKILSSELLNEFQAIRGRDNMFDKGDYFVSQLWFDENWSEEFADFILRLAEETDKIIKVIEIHPPYDNYCDSLDTFLKIYKVFENKVLREFPSAIINIENRCNPKPHLKGGKFIVSTNEDIINLAKLIPKHEVKLQLIVDIPQLLTAHYKRKSLSESMIREALSPLQGIRGLISSTHIWGSNIVNQKYAPHSGDFNTYIKDKNVNKCFLEEIYKLFDDDKERYFVPEVNKSEYVKSIVYDLRSIGVEFVEPE